MGMMTRSAKLGHEEIENKNYYAFIDKNGDTMMIDDSTLIFHNGRLLPRTSYDIREDYLIFVKCLESREDVLEAVAYSIL